jgi:hypothetical protein
MLLGNQWRLSILPGGRQANTAEGMTSISIFNMSNKSIDMIMVSVSMMAMENKWNTNDQKLHTILLSTVEGEIWDCDALRPNELSGQRSLGH